jgi:hypothetical protein
MRTSRFDKCTWHIPASAGQNMNPLSLRERARERGYIQAVNLF